MTASSLNLLLAASLTELAEWADDSHDAHLGDIAFRLRLMAYELEAPGPAESVRHNATRSLYPTGS